MEGRKVWKFLSILSPAQQQKWLQHLAFQYGEKQQYLQKLAAILVSHFPHPPASESCWEALYPDSPYDDGRIRKLAGDLTSTLEKFLSLLSQEEYPLDQKIHLLRGLIAQPDKDLFEQTWKKVCKDIYKYADSAAEIVRYRYDLEVTFREYAVHHRMKSPKAWTHPSENQLEDKSLQERISFLLVSWDLFKMLDFIVKMENESIKTNSRPEIPMEKYFLQLIEQDKRFQKLPLVSMYLAIINLLQGKTVELEPLIAYLYRYHSSLPSQELGLLYGSVLNNLIRNLNKLNSVEDHTKLLKLYVWGIRKKLLLHEGQLLPAHYKNYVKLCIRAKQLELADSFIQEYVPMLPVRTRQELPILCNIYLSFARKEFGQAIRLSNSTAFTSVRDELEVRTILLQSHYEKDPADTVWLDGQITSLIRYARVRKDLPPYLKESFVLQMNFMRRLFKSQTTEELSQLYKRLPQLASSPGLQRWFDQKIEERLPHKTITELKD